MVLFYLTVGKRKFRIWFHQALQLFGEEKTDTFCLCQSAYIHFMTGFVLLKLLILAGT